MKILGIFLLLLLLPFLLSAQSDSLKVFDLSKPGTNPTAVKTMSADLLQEDFMGSGNVEEWGAAIETATELNNVHGVKTYFFSTYSVISTVSGIQDVIESRIQGAVTQNYGPNTPYLLLTVLQGSQSLNATASLHWDPESPKFKGYDAEMQQIESTLQQYVNYKLNQVNKNSISAQYTDALLQILLDNLEYEKTISFQYNTGDLVLFVNGFWAESSFFTGVLPYNLSTYWLDDLDAAAKAAVVKYFNGNLENTQKQIDHMKLYYFPKSMEYFKADRRFYVDGGNYSTYTLASTRREDGRKLAKLEDGASGASTQKLIKDIKYLGYSDFVDYLIGEKLITEGSSLHFLTHSMGGAFAEGMIDEMHKSSRIKMGKVLHLSPAESKYINNTVQSNSSNAPIERVQIVSNIDDTILAKDGIGSSKPLLDVIDGVDLFACFYETEILRSLNSGQISTWSIYHATNIRDAIFEVVKTLRQVTFMPASPASGPINCTPIYHPPTGPGNGWYEESTIITDLFDIFNNHTTNGALIEFRQVCKNGNCYKINNFKSGPNLGKYGTTLCGSYPESN